MPYLFLEDISYFHEEMLKFFSSHAIINMSELQILGETICYLKIYSHT